MASAVICRQAGIESRSPASEWYLVALEGVADAFEECFLVVFYGAGFAVHEFFGVNDFSAVSMNYSLVTKTNAKCWDVGA